LEIITGKLFISRRLKKQIGENIVNVPCALKRKRVQDLLLSIEFLDSTGTPSLEEASCACRYASTA
jgi:hypothetical protein